MRDWKQRARKIFFMQREIVALRISPLLLNVLLYNSKSISRKGRKD